MIKKIIDISKLNPYKKEDKMEHLIERLKSHEYKKYDIWYGNRRSITS